MPRVVCTAAPGAIGVDVGALCCADFGPSKGGLTILGVPFLGSLLCGDPTIWGLR